MWRLLRFAAFTNVLAALSASASAQVAAPAGPPQAVTEPTRAIARAREIVEQAMARTLAPGAQLAVSSGGRMVWSRSFGCADLELDVPVGPQTRFRIGSVSKPLRRPRSACSFRRAGSTSTLPSSSTCRIFRKRPGPSRRASSRAISPGSATTRETSFSSVSTMRRCARASRSSRRTPCSSSRGRSIPTPLTAGT